MKITKAQKLECLQLYTEITNKEIVSHNLISMGNFAFFIEHCLLLPSSRTLKKEVLSLIASRKSQDLCLLISENIYHIARRDNVGENLDFRLKRIKNKYDFNKLNHFDMLLDEHDFPSWFQVYIPFILAENKDELYHCYLKLSELNVELDNLFLIEEFIEKLKFFTLKIQEHSLKWPLSLLLVDALNDQDYYEIMNILSLKLPTVQKI